MEGQEAGSGAAAGDGARSTSDVRWEGHTAEDLERLWSLPRVHLFDAVSSTNDVARRFATEGAPRGTVVLAEEQHAGRGRAGRAWLSPPGLGLWFSLVIGDVPAPALSTLPLTVALAVARALDEWSPRPARVKWPNDLMLEDRKVGGVLCESAWVGGAPREVIAGVGLNILHAEEDFPEELRSGATSLRLVAGDALSRLDVATSIMARLRAVVVDRAIPDELPISEISARDALAGSEVDVLEPATHRVVASGTACGIAADGSLRLDVGGKIILVRSGTVRARPS